MKKLLGILFFVMIAFASNNLQAQQALANKPLSLLVYPNPASKEFTIELSSLNIDKGIVNIIDLTGRKIYTKNFSDETGTLRIDSGNWRNGIYIIQLLNEENLPVLRKKIQIIQ